MNRIWFASELETVATFWRILRRDGITFGFTSHDRDLWFDDILHSASPGMVPSSIRRSADAEADSAEVEGALTHDAISAMDIATGRFDGAQVRIGLVDWETREREIVYHGTIGSVIEEDARFTAELISRKAELLADTIPRTSPTCRATFCGPGCALSPAFFTHETTIAHVDGDENSIVLTEGPPDASLVGGWLRWLDGPQAGITMTVMAAGSAGLVLDTPIDAAAAAGMAVLLREGCDHTFETCSVRFGNAANFQGEPHLPGDDMLLRYPVPMQ